MLERWQRYFSDDDCVNEDIPVLTLQTAVELMGNILTDNNDDPVFVNAAKTALIKRCKCMKNQTVNSDYVRAVKIQAKLAKLANLKASYKFRLAAMIATDNRQGQIWP